MPRFDEDLHREEVLAAFLDENLYPEITTNVERISDTRKQNAGHDVRVAFEWLDESVIADEKAQNSDKWLNDPSPTFVMEIFGESWLDDGEPDGNIGWFVDTNNETEYYVLIWLPDVSIFKLSTPIDNSPILHYRPADAIGIDSDEIETEIQSTIRYNQSKGEYRLELTPDVPNAFATVAEPLPTIIESAADADYGEWYYDPGHIHEAKVAIVEKEKIRQTLEEDGLTRDVLVEKGKRAITAGTVDVNSTKARKVMRSSGTQSGSADDEDPVILVVNYSTYHGIADKTVHYRDGSWSEDITLFDTI